MLCQWGYRGIVMVIFCLSIWLRRFDPENLSDHRILKHTLITLLLDLLMLLEHLVWDEKLRW